ncbi:hypothetical protein BC829DRAFT_399441 [Chytridium lagenaria]|nr:hypothetical protein BC829DRAFT_399441 [Chytridium lagenaria]
MLRAMFFFFVVFFCCPLNDLFSRKKIRYASKSTLGPPAPINSPQFHLHIYTIHHIHNLPQQLLQNIKIQKSFSSSSKFPETYGSPKLCHHFS